MKQNGVQAVMVARSSSAVTASPALRSRFSVGLVPAKLGSASSSQRFLPGFTNRGQVSTPSGLAWGGGTALAGCIPLLLQYLAQVLPLVQNRSKSQQSLLLGAKQPRKAGTA